MPVFGNPMKARQSLAMITAITTVLPVMTDLEEAASRPPTPTARRLTEAPSSYGALVLDPTIVGDALQV